MQILYMMLEDYYVAPDFTIIMYLNIYTFPYKFIFVDLDEDTSTLSTLRTPRFFFEVFFDDKEFQCTIDFIYEACSTSAPRSTYKFFRSSSGNVSDCLIQYFN